MATNAEQHHQQDVRGLEEGSWRQEWMAPAEGAYIIPPSPAPSDPLAGF